MPPWSHLQSLNPWIPWKGYFTNKNGHLILFLLGHQPDKLVETDVTIPILINDRHHFLDFIWYTLLWHRSYVARNYKKNLYWRCLWATSLLLSSDLEFLFLWIPSKSLHHLAQLLFPNASSSIPTKLLSVHYLYYKQNGPNFRYDCHTGQFNCAY